MRRKLDKFVQTNNYKEQNTSTASTELIGIEKLHPWQMCNNNINLIEIERQIIGHVIVEDVQHSGKLRITELHNNTMTQLYYITLNIST